MADLYGTNGHRSSSLESEEMSSFLHNLLHSSSFKAKENSDFSDPGAFFPGEARERTVNPFSSAGADSDPITSSRGNLPYNNNDANDFDFGSEEHEEHEVQANSVPPRSSKRTRAAEIHNLSEKRRRSRINEKLKALQNLIPNSNKTDKASMLDEAIEYLKQLQLQVQMLTMRNGLGLTSDYLPETLQTVQLTQRGVDFDDGNGMMNANRGDTVSTDPKFLAQTALFMTNPAPRNQPIVIPLIRTINNSETSYELEPSIPNQYQLLNHLASSKDICRVDSASEVQFDINCSGKNSSSGIS